MSSSASTRVRPTFIHVGPGRCASSWLLEVLASHPQIGMARIKETEYFNTYYPRGNGWYESLFPAAGKIAVGEVSNCYYTEPQAAGRIHEYDPGMQIMVNVRDPYALLLSFYDFGQRRGLKLRELSQELDTPIGRIMGSGYDDRARRGRLNQGDRVTLLDSVILSRHLEPYFRIFPQEQIYVFVFERLHSERDQLIREIYRFLKVDDSHRPQMADEIINSATVPRSTWAAAAASRLAFRLRQAGAYGLLDKLKKSRWLKRFLFADSNRVPRGETLANLPPEVCARLDREVDDMIRLYPPLARCWQPYLERSAARR